MVAWSAGAHAEATDGATRRTKAATALSSAVRALRCIPDPLLWWLPQSGRPYLKVSMGSSSSPRLYFSPRAAVAQLARASACHAEGRGFESHQPLFSPRRGLRSRLYPECRRSYRHLRYIWGTEDLVPGPTDQRLTVGAVARVELREHVRVGAQA